LFVFTVEVVVDVRQLEAEIFTLKKTQQTGSVNVHPLKQKLIQIHS